MGGPANVDTDRTGAGPAAPPRPAPTPPEQPPRGSRGRTVLLIVGGIVTLLVLVYAAVWGYAFAVSQLGAFAPVAFIIVVGLLAALVGPWLVRERGLLEETLGVCVHWLGEWLQAMGLSRAFTRRFPRMSGFIAARFARASPRGLGLTVTVVVWAALMAVFLDLAFQVTGGSALLGTDQRVVNLAVSLRTPGSDQVMYFITYLGSGQVIAAVAVVAILIALLAGRRMEALLLLVVTVGSVLSYELVKALVARPRPSLVDARILESGFSFPSGHATQASALYGLIAYLLLRGLRQSALRAVVGVVAAALGALLTLAVGISRVYLGVHFPSDVLAGWALGALWVALAAMALDVWPAQPAVPLARGRLTGAIAGVVVLMGLAAVYLYAAFPALPPAPAAPLPVETISPDAVPATVTTQLPHYTETLFGQPQEPVNVILVGTQQSLISAFTAAGWTEARQLTLGSFDQAITASVTARPDPAGPVTPSFLGDEPNTLAFNQPVGADFSQRHHIRIWSTQVVTSEGQNVWLATASFDEGFELAPRVLLPTHHINPNIDAERDFVVASLQQQSGAVANTITLQLVPPEQGHNFAGDPFYTNGQAVIVVLGS